MIGFARVAGLANQGLGLEGNQAGFESSAEITGTGGLFSDDTVLAGDYASSAKYAEANADELEDILRDAGINEKGLT